LYRWELLNDNNSEGTVTIGLRSRKTPSVGTPTYCTYTETTGYVLVRVITDFYRWCECK